MTPPVVDVLTFNAFSFKALSLNSHFARYIYLKPLWANIGTRLSVLSRRFFNSLRSVLGSILGCVLVSALLSGCGFNSDSDDNKTNLSCLLEARHLSFEDENNIGGIISGRLWLGVSNTQCNASHIVAQWQDTSGSLLPNALALTVQTDKSDASSLLYVQLPSLTVNENYEALRITPVLDDKVGTQVEIALSDRAEYTQVYGPGGNRFNHWYYGEDRPTLLLRTEMRGERKICLFENDNILIHDSAYETDPNFGKNTANDLLYPAFEFDCTDSKINTHRLVMTYDDDDNDVIHTYSMINDAFYYADLTFTLFEKYLAARPLEKLRVRVHYGLGYDFNYWAHWDGAYVNLNDVEFRAYGSASLDTISHEVAHGVLQAHSALKHAHDVDYSLDGRTLHEAYADITSVMANYAMTGELNWINGDENFAVNKRYLDRIETESGAVLSYLDYPQAGNYYQRMGILTYPFYLLTQAWGIEQAFTLYTRAATECWQPEETLLHAATCIHQQADDLGYNTAEVIEAFRTVKVKLAAEDTFAHFTADKRKRRVDFNNLTQTDRILVSHHWDFGDGQTSVLEFPQHVYSADGTYQVTLTVRDHVGVTDSFSRTLDVTDQYCAPREKGARHRIENVVIAGQTIPFDAQKWDYTDQIIQLNAGEDIEIAITGDKLNDTRERVTWYVNVDLNDDGIYTGVDYSDRTKSEQLLRKEVTGASLVLNSTFKVLEQYKGGTYYLRVSSDSTGFPCSTEVGNTFDVRVQVN